MCNVGEFYNIVRASYNLQEMAELRLLVEPMERREERLNRWQGRDSMGYAKPYDWDDPDGEWPEPPVWGA